LNTFCLRKQGKRGPHEKGKEKNNPVLIAHVLYSGGQNNLRQKRWVRVKCCLSIPNE
jgi:hypothetical protein